MIISKTMTHPMTAEGFAQLDKDIADFVNNSSGPENSGKIVSFWQLNYCTDPMASNPQNQLSTTIVIDVEHYSQEDNIFRYTLAS